MSLYRVYISLTLYYSLKYASVKSSGPTFCLLINFVCGVTFLVSPKIICAQNLDSDLVAYYPFNGNANDASGNGNDAVFNNAELTFDRCGIPNSAYQFNGVDQYIQIPHSASFALIRNEFTICAWVNPTNTYDTTVDSITYPFTAMMTKGNTPDMCTSWALGYFLWNGVLKPLPRFCDGTQYYAITDTTASVGLTFHAWQFVAWTFRKGLWEAWVNGTKTTSIPIPVHTLWNDQLPLEIGRDIPGTMDRYNGSLDDIRIYSRALTDLEVQLLYETPIGQLQVPSVSAQQGDTISLPLSIRHPKQVANLPASFIVKLKMNGSLLHPVDLRASESDSMIGDQRTVFLRAPLTVIGDTVFRLLKCLVTLGNDSTTPVILTHGDDQLSNVCVSAGLAKFTLQGICREGSTRLIHGTGPLLCSSVYPNPVTQSASFDYSLIEQGRTRLYVLDLLGRVVVSLVDEMKDPGKYAQNFSVTGLSTGMYALVFETPSARRRQLIAIVQ